MRKVINLLLSAVLVLMAVGCCALAACKEEPTNYRGLNFGKYYLETSDDVYIEIKADHKAYLHNLDFSDFDPDEFWGDGSDWVEGQISRDEVVAAMQGETNYDFSSDKSIVTFEIKKIFLTEDRAFVYSIPFNYNGTNELEFNGVKYIKK